MNGSSPIRIAIAAILAAASARTLAQTAELPVPCVAGVCGANVPGFVTSGNASATAVNNVLRITQRTDRAILNWASFNVGPDGRVIFDQPSSNSIALNRIFQGSPSRILGAIEANGQIYLINQNGFMFGPTARVRTSGLLVSSLNMLDSTFNNGLLSPDLLKNGHAALESDGRVGVLDPQGNPVLGDDGQPLKVQITIAAGAQISTVGTGGRVMVASRTVDNAGSIETPDGQVVLAAGEKVYLQASTDPALRGLLVEVDAGGEAWNRMTGNVSAARGNVTMVGLAVNQQGRVSATTSVAANGSVRLLARDSVKVTFDASQNPVLNTTRGGRLELSAGSQTTVLPESSDPATAIDEQKQLPSTIELQGRQVYVRGGAQVRANGGDIRIRALNDATTAQTLDPDARVRLESGAVVDASGSDATASVSRNVVRVELRGNELRDAPLQRDGVLRGKDVYVDARVGTPLADVSGAIAGIGRAIDERTAAGGTITVESFGDVVVAPGATLDVSGGTLTYTGGAVQTTQLLTADGRAIDIGQANPDQLYVGLINPSVRRSFDRWGVTEQVQGALIGRYEPGYTEGRSAGTLQFLGPALALDGNFLGGVTIGANQRDAAHAPAGGRFIVGADLAANAGLPDYRAPSINLVANAAPTAVTDTASLPPRPLELGTDALRTGGFTRLELYSNGTVHIPEALTLALAPGSSLRITAQRIEALGDVSAPGGSVRLASVETIGTGTAAPRGGIELGAGATFDVRGLWNNDLSLLTPIYRDGGELDFAVKTFDSELVLHDGVRLLADGGASLSVAGAVTGGAGGRIGLHAAVRGGAVDFGDGIELSAFGVANARGGAFVLEAPRLEIVDAVHWAAAGRVDLAAGDNEFLAIGDGLFSDYGFASFDVAAAGPAGDATQPDSLAVRAGAVLDARAQTLQLDGDVAARLSGGTAVDFAHAVLAPDFQRSATRISLRVDSRAVAGTSGIGRLSVARGATLRVDTRGSVNLSSVGGIMVGGDILAPGGTVTAAIPTPDIPNDPGYRANLGISFLDSATVDVAGTTLLRPNDGGLQLGEVVAGGSVSLLADRGFIAAAQGATFDLRGGSGVLDVPGTSSLAGYQHRTIGSNGGALTLRSPESIDFAATLRAQAGQGDTQSAGGSATFQLTRQRGWQRGVDTQLATYPATPRTLLVAPTRDALTAGGNGSAVVDASWVRASGIDTLNLEAGDRIEFYAGADLTLGRALTVAAPLVGVSGDAVTLAAPYLSLGTQVDTSAIPAVASVPGVAQLALHGDLVELTGRTTLTGVASTTITAERELRLRGFEDSGTSIGQFNLAGDLTLRAPLIYPATGTQFTITAAGGAHDRVRFEATGTASTGVPLSVGGSLTVNARSIAQETRLIAPFGALALNAGDDLTLGAGSVTSVSADGNLLPFGSVQLGSEWIYELGGREAAAPRLTPRVDLNGRDLTIDGSATVDLAGGGDLYAYEWVPGTGGSRDALAPGATPGLYAILPSLRDGFAPYDPQEFLGSDLQPGDSIYLSGTAGLPAGFYPLLPARYALLPGALLVSAVAGTTDAVPGVASSLADGTPVVAGYRAVAGTSIRDARTTGFAVRPGSYAKSLANYQDYHASTFAAANRPVAPDDAARMSLSAMRSMNLAGHVLTAAHAAGTGAAIDIAAPNLVLHGSGAPDTPGAVNLDATTLAGWNAASLVLGGRRGSDGRTLEVSANTLTFAAGTQLSGAEIIAVARDSLTLESGASLSSTGGTNAPQFADEDPLALSGANSGAALLGVSATRALGVTRDGSTSGGGIFAAAGSRIASGGSLLVDGPRAVQFDGAIAGRGATWSLGSSELILGGSGGGDGFTLDAALLADLDGAARVRLAASRVLTFAESLQLGTLDELTIDTPSIRAAADGLAATLAANSVTLLNSWSSAPLATGTALTGVLSFDARDVTLGPGSLAIAGFGELDLTARDEIVGAGVARLASGGDITLTAANIGAGSDADLSIDARGTLRTVRGAIPLASTARMNSQLGGRLALSGQNVEHAGSVRVASGRVELGAVDSLTIADGSVLDVSGAPVTAAGRTLGSGGGTLRLDAGGALEVHGGARLDVSGAGDADAGELDARSGGAANLAALLQAHAASGARGGRFVGEFGSLADFNALNDALEAGGFSARRALDVAAGDLTLAAGHSITARDVHLSTGGALTVAGTIDASSNNERGRIELAGAAGLTLAPGANLFARGTSGLGRGGDVLLASDGGDVNLRAGSRIAVDGASEAGQLTVRASATPDGMRLGEFAADVSGAAAIVLQPVSTFTLDPQPVAADFDAIRNSVTAWSGVATPALLARYSSSSIPLRVRPGIDLLTDGDLTLGSLDLAAWRFAGEPATLAFRATGAIDINGTISDGFVRVGAGANARIDLLAGDSSSLSFDAGSDLRVNAGARVRTGTGDLTLRAAGDLVFDTNASVYTGGVAAEPTHVFARGASLALPTRGGRVELDAGRDVIGAPVTQAVGAWQVRQARNVTTPPQGPTPPGWGTDIQQFGWNLGTLGGGDLVVRAGRDIRDLSAAAADSASLVGQTLTTYGGGVVQLDAGRDVTSAYVHMTRGQNLVRAGGELGRSRFDDNGVALGSVFSMQGASLDLVARRGIALETVFNPTTLAQTQTAQNFRSFFVSYAADSTLRASTASGDLNLGGSPDQRLIAFLGAEFASDSDALLSLLPPSVFLAATDGDIRVAGPVTLAPDDHGQLEMFASRDIVGATSSSVVMSDAANLPTALAPAAFSNISAEIVRSAASGRHAADDRSVLITAGRDITNARFEMAKFTDIAAGRDVRNLALSTQNVRGGDGTHITAGRDVIFDLDAGNSQIEVGGPGRLDVIAGRDVDLGFSAGISSVGRLVNPALTSERGADITVLAGAGPGAGLDVTAFLTRIVAPTTAYRSSLESYVAGLAGSPTTSFEDAVAKFGELAKDVQRAFLLPIFFQELVASGREANTVPGVGFSRGYAAIDALFPGSREPAATPAYKGDLKLAFSRIYTLADADISLLVPGGLLNVGLANPPPGLAGSRKPSELGIVAQRAGSVRIFTHDDVLVNQSRIFTLRGGDITIWSTTGDIDAGRGAKSAISAPAPTVLVDPTGRVTLDFAGAVAGSGIRGILTDEGATPGDVDLIAPAGIVDAGDAGIGAAGNLNVAAQQVVGLDNIQVGGSSTGVPAETGNLGAALSGASAAGSSASSAANSGTTTPGAQQSNAPLADSALGFLDVFLEGFGADVCKPDDAECLKRNSK